MIRMYNRESIRKILKILISLLAVTIVIIYSYTVFRDYIQGPDIYIEKPINGEVFTTPTVFVEGKVMHVQDLLLNGRLISMDREGNFKTLLLLSPGYNISTFQARDKFNRTIEYKLELVYKEEK